MMLRFGRVLWRRRLGRRRSFVVVMVIAASFAGVFVGPSSAADLSFGRRRCTVGIVRPMAWIVQFSDSSVCLNRFLLVQLATFIVVSSLEGLRRKEQKAGNETGCELHRESIRRCVPAWMEVGNLWGGNQFCEAEDVLSRSKESRNGWMTT